MRAKPFLILASVLVLGLAACRQAAPAPRVDAPTVGAGSLRAYPTSTGTATATPLPTATVTPQPSATATPQLHSVAPGEDLFGISLKYGVSLEALQAANPQVDARSLRIGQSLVIPERVTGQTAQPALLAPVAVEIGAIDCWPAATGGVWCFVRARNPHKQAVENISARLSLVGETGEPQTTLAVAALDLLPAGASMPLVAYLPPPLPERPWRPAANLLAALPVGDEGRYRPVQISEQTTRVEDDGRTALVAGRVQADAGQVWLAAVAYNAAGQVVGVRRWQGASGDFRLAVYSAGDAILRVELFSQARP